jgi:hypothetical protein
VVKLFAGEQLQIFHSEYSGFHFCTDYERWLRSNETAPFPAKCWQLEWEPYTSMLRTELLPDFDERFAGFGGNRVTQLIESFMRGVRFVVHPSAFLVHLSHRKQSDDERIHKYWRSTNEPMHNRFYYESLFRAVARLGLVPPFPVTANGAVALPRERKRNSSLALVYECGDVLQVLNYSTGYPASTTAAAAGELSNLWYGRNERTGATGYFSCITAIPFLDVVARCRWPPASSQQDLDYLSSVETARQRVAIAANIERARQSM